MITALWGSLSSDHFTPDDGTVIVDAHLEAAGSLCLSVIDTGIGMTPHEIAIALERFRQVDETYTKRFEGTGLGLPIVKELVAMHGGALDIESAPGKGTTVRVRLPIDRVVPHAVLAMASRTA